MALRQAKDYKPAVDQYRGCTPEINGWCTEADAREYKQLVSQVHNGNIMEVGSYEGLSLFHIKDICKENNTKIYCVDFIAWPKLVENTTNWGIDFTNLPSVEAADKFENEFFDLIYIDADHHTTEVAYDIWSWLPKLKKQGILAGHDYQINRIRKALKYIFGNAKLQVSGDVWSIQKPHDQVINFKT